MIPLYPSGPDPVPGEQPILISRSAVAGAEAIVNVYASKDWFDDVGHVDYHLHESERGELLLVNGHVDWGGPFVAVPGTRELRHWRANLDPRAQLIPGTVGRYRRGWCEFAEILAAEFIRHSRRDIVAHSLGAAVTAQALAILAAQGHAEQVRSILLLAPPGCMTADAARWLERCYPGKIVSLVHGADIVPRALGLTRWGVPGKVLYIDGEDHAREGSGRFARELWRALWTAGLQTVGDHGAEHYLRFLRGLKR